MESHCNKRKNTADWQADQVNIVNFLRGPCKLANKYTEEQIHQACGILAVNAFEVRSSVSGGNPVRALYPQVSNIGNWIIKLIGSNFYSSYLWSKHSLLGKCPSTQYVLPYLCRRIFVAVARHALVKLNLYMCDLVSSKRNLLVHHICLCC